MHKTGAVAQASGVEASEIETAHKRLMDARQVLDHGRDGASAAWLDAVEDYISKCQEEYVRALERANTAQTQRPTPRLHSDPDGLDPHQGPKPH
jgi:hypothetical protein